MRPRETSDTTASCLLLNLKIDGALKILFSFSNLNFYQFFCCWHALLVCTIKVLTTVSEFYDSAKLIDVYRTKHNINASTGLSDVAVATGISELVYESSKPAPAESDTLDDDLVNAWAANLGDDGLLGNNAPAMNRVSFSPFSSIMIVSNYPNQER